MQPSDSESDEDLQLKLFDLSVSGFALICDSLILADKIILDSEFIDAELILNDTESYKVSFIPRNKTPINPGKPDKSQRIGCEFLNLSPRAETAFLRYMQDIERELKKNQRD